VARCSPRGRGMSRAPKGTRSMAGYLQGRGARLVRERRVPCVPLGDSPLRPVRSLTSIGTELETHVK
jgi:hypothetical protein